MSSGADGTCGPIQAGIDPDNECAVQLSSCGNTGFCDGAGACQKKPAGTSCGAASCNGSTLTQASACNGSDTCAPGGTQDCGNYLCAAGACPSSYVGHAQCAATAYCGGGACLAKTPEDASCGANAQCVSDACIAGVCRLDADNHGIADEDDNCPFASNPFRPTRTATSIRAAISGFSATAATSVTPPHAARHGSSSASCSPRGDGLNGALPRVPARGWHGERPADRPG